jgi:hypothetical protein
VPNFESFHYEHSAQVVNNVVTALFKPVDINQEQVVRFYAL